jgi:hypothetical protein
MLTKAKTQQNKTFLILNGGDRPYDSVRESVNPVVVAQIRSTAKEKLYFVTVANDQGPCTPENLRFSLVCLLLSLLPAMPASQRRDRCK